MHLYLAVICLDQKTQDSKTMHHSQIQTYEVWDKNSLSNGFQYGIFF